jgi:hypothetical protein
MKGILTVFLLFNSCFLFAQDAILNTWYKNEGDSKMIISVWKTSEKELKFTLDGNNDLGSKIYINGIMKNDGLNSFVYQNPKLDCEIKFNLFNSYVLDVRSESCFKQIGNLPISGTFFPEKSPTISEYFLSEKNDSINQYISANIPDELQENYSLYKKTMVIENLDNNQIIGYGASSPSDLKEQKGMLIFFKDNKWLIHFKEEDEIISINPFYLRNTEEINLWINNQSKTDSTEVKN